MDGGTERGQVVTGVGDRKCRREVEVFEDRPERPFVPSVHETGFRPATRQPVSNGIRAKEYAHRDGHPSELPRREMGNERLRSLRGNDCDAIPRFDLIRLKIVR
jgi:hypothetical protein